MTTDNWRDRALCAHPSVAPQDFSPVDTRGRLDEPKARSIAARLCRPCPVRDHCLAWAVDEQPQEIVAAGMWWPARPSRGDPTRHPLDLFITDQPTHDEEAAAA